MRIIFVRPNSILRATTIPLGIGYVAQAARRAGHEACLLDARLNRLRPEETARRIIQWQPDLVGVSGIHYEMQGVRDLANALKNADYQGPLLLGGPLASTSGQDLVGQGLFDAAVEGEGEEAVVAYADVLSGQADRESVPGLVYSENGTVKSNPPATLTSIDQLVPAWDLIGPEQYFNSPGRHTLNVLSRSPRSLSLFSSRGCPFNCIYCHNVFGKRFRARPAEAVLDEIEMLVRDYGIKEIEFVDDAFNLDLSRAKRIAQMMVERDLKLYVSFSNGLRADRMDEELLDLLKRAGTYRINYAVESASPRVQKLIRKNLDLDKTAQVIEWTADRGIFTFGYFMMGFPDETEEELQMTVDYAMRSKFHAAGFFYVNPFPNTELARSYPLPDSWEAANAGMDYTAFSLNMSAASDETLKKIYRRAYRKFHFQPYRMWRTLKVVPKNWYTIRSVVVVAVLSFFDLPNF